MRPVICLVTDRSRFGAVWEDEVVARVRAAAEAGVHLVQVRERGLETRDLLRLVTRCRDAVQGTAARVLVNDRLDVALAAGAHGVHLPAGGVPAARVRAVVPPAFLIGRSVHDPREAELAARDGAVDYLIFGTVFPSRSKPDVTAAGLAWLHAAAAVGVPVLAIGGMTSARMDEVAASGASGFAAIGLFSDGDAASILRNVHRAAMAFDTLRRKDEALSSKA